jgi:hypothetical protein
MRGLMRVPAAHAREPSEPADAHPPMSARRLWLGLVVLYGGFTGWYTSWAGPLAPGEVDAYIARLAEKGASGERIALWRHFLETDTGDDFAMWNAIDLRDAPLAVDGVPPGESSRQMLERYTGPFLGKALARASHPVMIGTAASEALDLWGIDGAKRWTMGGLVRYRSRRDVVELALAALGSDIHRYKIAAMEKTIAFPLDPWFQLGDPRLVLALVFAIVGLVGQLRSARNRASTP